MTYNIDKKAVGKRIKNLRKEKNLSIKGACDFLEILDSSTLKRHESGSRLPLIYNCVKYAHNYGTSIGYIIGYQFIPEAELERYDRLMTIFQNIMMGNQVTQEKLFKDFAKIIENHPEYKNADTVGKRLYLERTSRKLDQKEVLSCIYQQCISKYEQINELNSDGNNCIKVEHIVLLAERYEVSVDYLIRGIDYSYLSLFYNDTRCMNVLHLLANCSNHVQDDVLHQFELEMYT